MNFVWLHKGNKVNGSEVVEGKMNRKVSLSIYSLPESRNCDSVKKEAMAQFR